MILTVPNSEGVSQISGDQRRGKEKEYHPVMGGILEIENMTFE